MPNHNDMNTNAGGEMATPSRSSREVAELAIELADTMSDHWAQLPFKNSPEDVEAMRKCMTELAKFYLNRRRSLDYIVYRMFEAVWASTMKPDPPFEFADRKPARFSREPVFVASELLGRLGDGDPISVAIDYIAEQVAGFTDKRPKGATTRSQTVAPRQPRPQRSQQPPQAVQRPQQQQQTAQRSQQPQQMAQPRPQQKNALQPASKPASRREERPLLPAMPLEVPNKDPEPSLPTVSRREDPVSINRPQSLQEEIYNHIQAFGASVRKLKDDTDAFDKLKEEAEWRLGAFRWPRHRDANAFWFLKAIVGFTTSMHMVLFGDKYKPADPRSPVLIWAKEKCAELVEEKRWAECDQAISMALAPSLGCLISTERTSGERTQNLSTADDDSGHV
ncbi:hypothetical protein C8A03DRAFT_38713 [Achaetomium macrosporum]|uniref:Uncharacterized protein n=1 Tax=Achaetomium macrosporum TaxID=79813 RepID=A0AAN7C1E3_9PEZI|nr:hypothetical protein C8A03DRAFT_38713 [Achaetomium macrosporum]